MRILLTGSSGWLGRFLAPRLRQDGHEVAGLDVAPGADTDVIGSVADRALVDRIFAERGIEAVVHAGALHKPDIARYPKQAFVDVNVTGTLNLLEAAAAAACEPLRLHLDHLADDLAGGPGRKVGRGHARGLADGGFRAAGAAQHLRSHQARRRAIVRPRPPRARAARRHPAHRPLLPRGGRHPPRPFRPQHQGQRVPQPPPHRRGLRRGPCRGAGEGAGDRLRHSSSSPLRRPSPKRMRRR